MENRHPSSLYYLFLTEMWERFGFYVVQGLLILYMTEYFGFTDNQGYTIIGTFTALAYIAPLAGGYVASRFIGYETAVTWGGIFLMLGYFVLALPVSSHFIYPALATVIIGNGLLKPNISSLLGAQYEINDVRRDSGFTIFYVGINIGALLAGLCAGYIKEYFGWHVSFALASLGLLIGLTTFFIGRPTLKKGRQFPLTFSFKLQFLFFCLLAIAGFNFLLRMEGLTDWILPCVGFFVVIYLAVLTLQQEGPYKKQMFLLTLLILASLVFWTLYWQLFYSANLFVERLVNKNLFGIPLTSTLFWGSEAVFIILLGPFFAWMWHKLSLKKMNPSPFIKFSLGILLAGCGFFVLALSTKFANAQNLVAPGWVFFSYLLITLGELFLSPIGLSAVTVLAPPHLVSFMMGVWFVATGFGGIFAGVIAKIASIPQQGLDLDQKLLIYQHAFFVYAYLAFFIGIMVLLSYLASTRFINRQ